MQDKSAQPGENRFGVLAANVDVQLVELEFVRASDRVSDPVGTIEGDWGFWDETWSDWHGGHADETAARAACSEYAKTL